MTSSRYNPALELAIDIERTSTKNLNEFNEQFSFGAAAASAHAIARKHVSIYHLSLLLCRLKGQI